MYSEETLVSSHIHGNCIRTEWAVMTEGDDYELSTSRLTLRQLVDNHEIL